MPAYEWPGAGSEKGGSAEHMLYEQVVFLPEKEGRVFGVSVGDKQFDFMHTLLIGNSAEDLSECDVRSGVRPSYYSVLFRFSVSPAFADTLLDLYHTHIKGKEKRDYTFAHAFEDVLKDGTRNYIACPLFAVDPSEKSLGSGRVYANRHGFINDFSRGSLVEVPDFWRDRLHGDLTRRKDLSHCLSQYLQGETVDPSFRNSSFDQAFKGWSSGFGGQSNAYHPQEEEKSIQRLEEKYSTSVEV